MPLARHDLYQVYRPRLRAQAEAYVDGDSSGLVLGRESRVTCRAHLKGRYRSHFRGSMKGYFRGPGMGIWHLTISTQTAFQFIKEHHAMLSLLRTKLWTQVYMYVVNVAPPGREAWGCSRDIAVIYPLMLRARAARGYLRDMSSERALHVSPRCLLTFRLVRSDGLPAPSCLVLCVCVYVYLCVCVCVCVCVSLWPLCVWACEPNGASTLPLSVSLVSPFPPSPFCEPDGARNLAVLWL